MSKKPFGVLILHGFTACLASIQEVEPPLKALGLPTRLPVLRGHNTDSPEALRGVTWHDWMADAESALQDLLAEVEKVIIIGHSMGGELALLLATNHGEQLDSLILAAASVQPSTPVAPGKPLHFLVPVLARVMKKWDFPPIYADISRAEVSKNYWWAPSDASYSFVKLTEETRKHLAEVKTPALIMQSRNDALLAPESVEIIYNRISTPSEQKRVVWFEKTGHDMFFDCEREAVIKLVTEYVRERIGGK
jgi:carboxylesterase